MYSYEDRIRAVRLYMKLGKRTGATIRELEYLLRKSSNKNFGYPFCIEQQLPEDCSVIGFTELTTGQCAANEVRDLDEPVPHTQLASKPGRSAYFDLSN